MNDTELERFKTLLLTRKTALLELEKSTLDQELAQIEGALRRITSEDFGYCFKCDEEIDPRRLEANPTLTRCIKCADK